MLEYRFSMEDEDDDFDQESNISMDDDIGDYDEDDEEETIVVTETVISSVLPTSAPVIDIPAWPNDPSLDLVVDLAAQVDWDAAEAPGFGTHEDASDQAISQLTAGERRELQRLLKEELARSGA